MLSRMMKPLQEQSSHSKNNVVPESELSKALNAMEQCLQAWKDQGVLDHVDDNTSHKTLLHQLLTDAQRSVSHQLQNIVETISDEDYHHRYMASSSQLAPLDNDEDMDDESFDNSESDEEVDEDEDEFDEEELMDHEAQARARELRAQVRDVTERVSVLRTSVTSHAETLSQRQLALASSDVKYQEQDIKPYDLYASVDRFDLAANNKSKLVVEMEETLQRLTTALQEMDVALPEKMEKLQETMETIEEAMKQGTSLSQTEQAIQSRVNEGPTRETSTHKENIPPEQLLGAFLGQY